MEVREHFKFANQFWRSQMISFFILGHWDPRIKVNTKIMREKKKCEEPKKAANCRPR